MSNTKIKAGQFSGIVSNGTDGYFLMTNGDGTMAWAEGGATGPSVTSVSYPGDDLAADPVGGQTVVLTGTGFAASGMTVSIGGTTAPSVAHDSNTQLTITTPAKAAGDYDIVVTNTVTGASGTFVNGISYNGVPTWTTATGSLGTFESETTISTITLQATEPDGGTITFNITNGALPTGLSLTGANIDGTTTAESSTTLYSFTIEAIDDENQATPRNFSITVNSAAIISSENFTINTYTGNGSTQSIEGKIGTAASFNGTTSQIRTVGNPIPSTSSLFSISFWFQLDNTNTNNHIFSIFDNVAGTNKLLIRSLTGGDFQIGVYGISGSNFISTNSSTFPYTTGVWYHLVYISRSDGNNEFWIDGTQITTSSGVAANTTSSSIPITMGGRGDLGASSTERFGGKLDQVRIFDKALSSGEVTTLHGETYASTTKSTTDIFEDGSGVALYEFDGDANDTGSPIDSGQSAVFNGSSSYITFDSYTVPVNDYAFSFWFRLNDTASEQHLIAWDSLGGGRNYGIKVNVGSNKIQSSALTSGGSTSYIGSTSITLDNNWHHLVYLKSSTAGVGHSLWYDGVKIAEDTSFTGNTNTGSGSGNTIGVNTTESQQFLNGSIDQVRIYSSALSSGDITNLYNESNVPTANLVAHYKLDGNGNDETTNYNATAVSNITYSDEVAGIYYNGTPTNVNFLGMAFQPDLVWIKSRTSAYSHRLFDSVRGADISLTTNSTAAEYDGGGTGYLPSFDSNGFSLTSNTQVNQSSGNYVAWCWKAGGAEVTNTDGVTSGSVTAVTSTVSANQDAGFSICEFTTPSSGKPSWGHGLSQEPELIIVKNAGSTGHWLIYAPSILGQKELRFTTAQATPYTPDFISADSSKIDLGSSSFNIAGSSRHINYNFHSVDGYQKVGSYLGNNTTNVVTTGFKPRFLLIKASSHASSWYIVDSTRIDDNFLSPDLSAAEYTDAGKINFTSTGFTLTSTSYNNAGYTWVYLAIA